MGRYDGELIISYDHEASRILRGEYWRVRKSFNYFPSTSVIGNEWTCYDSNEKCFVAAGTLTDLGSVPRMFRGIIDNGGQHAQDYVLHDTLCEYLTISRCGKPLNISRQRADLILLDAMLSQPGASKAYAQIVYNAVAVYQMAGQVHNPTTTALKRQLEAQYNFEDLK